MVITDNPKILITGHKGFIGKYLWKALHKDFQLFGFDRGDSLPDEGVDMVYHLAANANAYESTARPDLALENVQVMVEVLNWMAETDTRNIIYTSSREVYSLTNPYGASKASGEMFLSAFSRFLGIGAISARLSNIYGEGNHPNRFIETAIHKAKGGEDIVVYGGRNKVMNFVHIDDCIYRLVELMGEMVEGEHKALDIASELSQDLVSVSQLIINLIGSDSEVVEAPERGGETLAFVPKRSPHLIKTSLEDGIKRCL